jgi:hypothetical protein
MLRTEVRPLPIRRVLSAWISLGMDRRSRAARRENPWHGLGSWCENVLARSVQGDSVHLVTVIVPNGPVFVSTAPISRFHPEGRRTSRTL